MKANIEAMTDELKEKDKKIDKTKKKKSKLKDEKKEKKEKIKEVEKELEQAEQRTQDVKAEREEANEHLRMARDEIEAHLGVIAELKEKLTEAMDTLKKNSETIEFLNKSLTEAQKFSFRALLSSKQNIATGSVAAVATARVERKASESQVIHRKTGMESATLFSENRVENNSALSRSRSRSPYGNDVRQSSNSPLRLMQK